MAEKEERIWIEFDIPKPKGAIEATRCITMTRQEAIKLMAKAICKVDAICLSDSESLAEAALNALLDEKRG